MSVFMNDYDRIAEAIAYLTANVREQPSLEEVAEKVHLSPFHFQRMFSEWAGISPKKFLQFLTASYLKDKLKETANLNEAADLAGLSSQSRVYDLFTGIEAVTPQEYRSQGKGLDIHYGFHPTPFGHCFLAVTTRGICRMAFVEAAELPDEIVLLKKKWSFATHHENQELTETYVQRIFRPSANPGEKLHLLVQGTNFQLKVWEALLSIPPGALTTYQGIATSIGHPKAVRAVGNAVGANPIAYLIPCHRIIRKEGILGEYRWGKERKKALIGWEAAR